MNRKTSLLLVVLMSIVLSACASKPAPTQTSTASTSTPSTSSEDTSNAFGTGLSIGQLESLGIVGDPLNYNVVYFAYNSSVIDRRSEVILKAHARNLVKRGGARVTLEGHADERGTRDYNLALGERRANQASDILRAEGAGNRIQTISYGEERPVNTAHNEAAWAENRRVKISY